MAKLNVVEYDRTLAEVDKALEQKKNSESPRHYLGMSQIGEECMRKLFYSFRNAEERSWEAQGVRNIEDGHLQEDVMAERLRMVPGIELITHDPENENEQIGFSLLLDHFRGHCDGAILGIVESPGTWHCWEHKSVGETSFNQLKKIREEKGEKNALREWNIIYYAQAQIYMHEMRLTRHFLTVSLPGGRDYISIRTEYNRKEAEAIIEKAKSIIFDNWILPERISDKREFYKCKWCEYQEICHDGAFPLVNCKTCRYSEPVQGGQRECGFSKDIISEEILHAGCKYHVYNPALVQAKLIEHLEEGCLYRIESKNINFANVFLTGIPPLDKKIDAMYTSAELREKIKTVDNINPQISDNVKAAFAGTECEDTKAEKKMWNDGLSKKIDPRLKGI